MGHSDGLLVGAGSGLLTGGISSSAGVFIADGDVFLPAYNDKDAVTELVNTYGDELAAIIVEPIAGNMGMVEPRDGFLEHLRAEASRCGALLIFDEVITGFRFGPTAYAELVGVTPDLVTLGKIIGGGMPLAALGGRKEIMQKLAPIGDVYQAGTLSGNPVAVAAGMKTVNLLIQENPYLGLAARGARLEKGLADADVFVSQKGGVFTLFFGEGPICNLNDAKACDAEAYGRFFNSMLAQGFYLPPSQFECAFVSAAHTDADIDAFVSAVKDALA